MILPLQDTLDGTGCAGIPERFGAYPKSSDVWKQDKLSG